MSDFDELDKQAQAAQLTAFGDTVVIIPQTSSLDWGSSADGSRPQAAIKAVFSQAASSQRTQGTSQGSDMVGATKVAAGLSELWISKDVYATLGYEIRAKDYVVFRGTTYLVVWPLPATTSGDRTFRLSVKQ